MKIVIVSGFFNPLHGGHLDMIEAAAAMGDKLIVVVNNDVQQQMKKGKIILDEQNRMRLMAALREVDEVFLSIDDDPGQSKSLRMLREKYPTDELIFANGGDRTSTKVLPENEAQACVDCNIAAVFGVGSHDVEKRDSSTRINQATGKEAVTLP
jgi:glycerol-3-phosphate cytidylyltransferase/D-beta-D-heptose 7-phosphate kinase/D-beta-D-heptose 1-phosphate adenosyltransferase